MRTAIFALLTAGCIFLSATATAQSTDQVAATSARAIRTVAAFSAERHGVAMRNGDRYDHYGYTAAHPSLPFGTRLQLKRLDDSRSVIVRVTDRPADGHSVIVSGSAGQALGLLRGSALIEQIPLGTPPPAAATLQLASTSAASRAVVRTAASSAPTMLRYTLQLAAYRDAHFAERFAKTVEGARVETQMKDGAPIYRVFVGDYGSRTEAQASSDMLARRGFENIVKGRRLAS